MHPEHRRQGIGGRAARRAGGGRDAELGWAHGRRPAALAFAAARGWTAARTLWQLRRPLTDEIPDAPLPAGITLRPFVPGQDEDAWVAVNARAFAHHPEQGAWTARDVRLREAEPWFDPAGFLLAVRDDGSLAGFHWTKVHAGPAADRRGLRARRRPVRPGAAARAGADRGRPAAICATAGWPTCCSTWTTTTPPRCGSTSGSASREWDADVQFRRLQPAMGPFICRSTSRHPAFGLRCEPVQAEFTGAGPLGNLLSLPSSPAPAPGRRHLSAPASCRAGIPKSSRRDAREAPAARPRCRPRRGRARAQRLWLRQHRQQQRQRQQRVRQRVRQFRRLRLRHAVLRTARAPRRPRSRSGSSSTRTSARTRRSTTRARARAPAAPPSTAADPAGRLGRVDRRRGPQQGRRPVRGGKAINLPMVLTPVEFIYNIQGVSDLTVTPSILAKIFSGKITNWNDPEIADGQQGRDAARARRSPRCTGPRTPAPPRTSTKFLAAQVPAALDRTAPARPGRPRAARVRPTRRRLVQSVKGTDGADRLRRRPGRHQEQPDAGQARRRARRGRERTRTRSARRSPPRRSSGDDQDIVWSINYGLKDAGAYPAILATYQITCTKGLPAEQAKLVKSLPDLQGQREPARRSSTEARLLAAADRAGDQGRGPRSTR